MEGKRFSSLYPGQNFGVGHYGLAQRPDLAAMVLQTIAVWSEVDFELAKALAHLMKADASVSSAVFLTLTTTSAKIKAIKAASETGLKGDALFAVRVVLAAYKGIAPHRDKFAHGIFGWKEDDPSILICWSISDHTKHHITPLDPDPIRGNIEELSSFLADTGLVYDRSDLQNILARVVGVLSCARYLAIYLSGKHPAPDLMLSRLKEQPVYIEFQKSVAQ